MTRYEKMPMQFDRPLFVKQEFNSAGRDWKKNDEYKWKELSIDENKVLQLYALNFLHHNSELETKINTGDGLEALNIVSLHGLVDTINKKVESKTTSKADFARNKCKKSKVVDKQRGLIRSWRRNFGNLEID
tara:strand:+ start:320 stop:715 length:396 start_codon:yes stop_codon:yes gene_type:complete